MRIILKSYSGIHIFMGQIKKKQTYIYIEAHQLWRFDSRSRNIGRRSLFELPVLVDLSVTEYRCIPCKYILPFDS